MLMSALYRRTCFLQLHERCIIFLSINRRKMETSNSIYKVLIMQYLFIMTHVRAHCKSGILKFARISFVVYYVSNTLSIFKLQLFCNKPLRGTKYQCFQYSFTILLTQREIVLRSDRFGKAVLHERRYSFALLPVSFFPPSLPAFYPAHPCGTANVSQGLPGTRTVTKWNGRKNEWKTIKVGPRREDGRRERRIRGGGGRRRRG